ncbi:hypothetical protein GSI_11028 [Ganoderma sinense ZZ0214-1]|uniref:Uncharacterized protein n=1 Tax=Ganoderma sinense ZZ0214-1 TaxID=1077348 RepID=A0A2G8RZW5_9APHY|nr:hypothetical protein GSI_11028 [Ganoderma sinense ZZ0214-1]
MVREEYLELWDFLKDAYNGKHYEGLVVTGQPGIGKTRFLHYALARALKEHIPVAFCDGAQSYYFCDATGCRLYSTADRVLHKVEPGKFFLALVDSNAAVKSPPQVFIDRSQFCYTVQATSPQPDRWRNWAKEREAAEYWVMSPWVKSEVRKLQNFCEQEGPCPWKDSEADYYSPLELFDSLGPSPRACFSVRGRRRIAGPEEDFFEYLRPDDALRHVDDFIAALTTSMVTPVRQGENFHRLFFASKPYDTSNPMPYGPQFHYTIPTDLISRLLFKYFNKRSLEEQLALLSKFAPYPQLMGLVLEPLVLMFLTSSEDPIPCHLVSGLTIMLRPRLRTVDLQVDPDIAIEVRHNDIHVPRGGFPSLDAFIIIIDKDPKQILLLQMTVASTHKVVSKGVAAIIKLIEQSTESENYSFKFIFVTPGPSGEKMAKKLENIKIRIRGPPSVDVEAGWIETGSLLGPCPEEILRQLQRFDTDNVVLDNDGYEEPPQKLARTTL